MSSLESRIRDIFHTARVYLLGLIASIGLPTFVLVIWGEEIGDGVWLLVCLASGICSFSFLFRWWRLAKHFRELHRDLTLRQQPLPEEQFLREAENQERTWLSRDTMLATVVLLSLYLMSLLAVRFSPFIERYLVGSQRSTPEQAQVNLSRLDLSARKLRGINLRDAVLAGDILKNSDLTHADLSGCDLGGADLRGAILTGANLDGADLRNTDLRDVKGLTSSQLMSAKDRRGVILSD